MEIIVFAIIALFGAIMSAMNPIIGISIEALAFLACLNYMTIHKHRELPKVLFPAMGGAAIGILIIYSFVFGLNNNDKAYKDDIIKNGGYFAIGEIQDKKTYTYRNGNKSYSIIFKDVCDCDGSLISQQIGVSPTQYNHAQIGDKYILAKKYETTSYFVIWNSNPVEENIKLMQKGLFTGEKSREAREKFTHPTQWMKIAKWVNSKYGILTSIVLIIIFMVWSNKQDEKITLASYNVLILGLYILAMPDSLITFNCSLMMICFLSKLMPWEDRIRKSLKKNGGYVTIGELSKSTARYTTYYIKMKDWNNIEQEYKQNNSQCATQLYEKKSKAIVVLPLGIERTPIIITTNENIINNFSQGKFIEKYEKLKDIYQDESLELREKITKSSSLAKSTKISSI